MITKVFGHINCNFKEALIPRDLLDDLVSYLNEENFLTKNEIKDQFTKESDSKVLKTFRQTSQNIEELISIYSRCWNLDPSKDIVGRLHSFLRKEFSEYFISPICFVNSRAWETKKSSNLIGPSSPHTDGMDPGHLKIMIYPNGLNKDFGQFCISRKNIGDKPPGFAIAFLNSKAEHYSVPVLAMIG